MNTVFKVMAFSIVINFAIGIMMTAIPAFGDDPSTMGGMSYDSNYSSAFVGEMNQSITPSGVLEDKGNAIYRVLDMMNIGFISRFLESIRNYIFGFVKLLDNMIGGYLDPIDSVDRPVRTILFGNFPFGILYVLMTIGYIYGAWVLWTGKSLD